MKNIGRVGWLLFGAYLLVTYGCATTGSLTPVSPGQEQAVWIIWHVYGRTETPPKIRWKQGAELDCVDPHSEKPGFTIPDPDEGTVCREGLTWNFTDVIVAWHGELSFSQTALAHELLHGAQARAGVFDPRHERDEWRPCVQGSSARCGLLDRANDEVAAAGL